MKKGNLYRWLKYDGPISRHYTKVPDSIYRDFKGFKAPSLKIVSIFHDTMGAMLKMDGLVIGSDKFSHFFNRGMKYYKMYTGKSKETKKMRDQQRRREYMLEQGHESEVSIWGSKSTGVASYGDLAANFQGMRFWNDMFGTTLDPVTGNKVETPYLSCNRGIWTLQKEVDIRKYLNTAWDEGFNCSKFRTKTMANDVKKNVSSLKPQDNKNIHCPINLAQLQTTKEIYGDFYKSVVNEVPYLSIYQQQE